MGVVFCSCTQSIIYAKEKQVVEINQKVQEEKNISNKNTNNKLRFKEKHLTKDSTLVNYNNNSPDNHESIKNLTKNNLTEIEQQNNNSKKNENKYNKTFIDKSEKKHGNNIVLKITYDKENHIKENNNKKTNNIHVISPNYKTLSQDSFSNDKQTKKVDKFLSINSTKGSPGKKNLIGFRADSFNVVENPIKNIYTNKSNNIIKNSPKKKLIANKTLDGTNNEDRKNLKLAFSIKTNGVFGQENQKLLWYYLHKHFMIMEYNEEFINFLMDYINILKYKNKEIIFKNGELANNFYIIKQGTVMLLSKGKIYKKLTTGNTFGEISLFQKEANESNENHDISESFINYDALVRNYTAISYGTTELFVINKNSYNIVLKAFSSKLKTIDYNENQDELKEQNKDIIDNYIFFKYLENSKKDLILRMSKIFHFKNSGALLTVSNYNKRDSVSLLGGKPFFRSKQSLIFPIKGEILEISENLSYRKKISKNECIGISPTLYPKIKNELIIYIQKQIKKLQKYYI